MEPVKFDPEHVDYPKRFGYTGDFPKTPCSECGGEWFRWVGDWNMGYWCVDCRQIWRPRA